MTTKITSQEIVSTVDRAREELNRNGWLKGGFGYNEGPKCMIGALRFAYFGDTHGGSLRDDAPDIWDLLLNGTELVDPAEFNDYPGTTRKDIDSVLDSIQSMALEVAV